MNSPAGAESRLELVEFLLGNPDLEGSARRSLEWLSKHAGAHQAILAVVDEAFRNVVVIAEHGAPASSGWQFTLDLDRREHPLVGAMSGTEPAYFPLGPSQPWTPLEGVSYYAVPIPAGEEDQGASLGLLLIGTNREWLSPDVRWFAEIFGQQISRVRRRLIRDKEQVGREKMLLYSIINAVTDPILLTDTEGKLIIANTRAEKLFAAPEDASEGWRRAVALNNMLFSAALSSSAVELDEPFRGEILLADPIDGSDLLFEHLTSAGKDAREGTYVVSVLRNITDLGRATQEMQESQRRLQLAEAEVREQRHRLELIIDSVADPILVTGPTGDIVLMNAPAERLFTTGPGRGMDIQRRVSANGAHFTSFVSNLLFSGTDQRWRGEIGLVEPLAGKPMPVEAIAGKILSAQGELTWVVTILHDRTEAIEKARLYEQLKEASQELEEKVRAATAELAKQNELLRRQALALEQASTLKSQFLANMSHEYRTPLNAILGYTHMLLKGMFGKPTPSQRRCLLQVDSNGRNMLALINEILDITRIEAGRMPVHVTEFKVPELVSEVVSELAPIIARSRLDVSAELAPKLPLVRGDRLKVKQILLNLLGNALKFTPRGSIRIKCKCHIARKSISIAVKDTGIGIAARDHEKVFEDFQQVDSSTTKSHGGTGLGLSISRRLARMLDGDIRLESELGRGSTFTLTLPARLRRR